MVAPDYYLGTSIAIGRDGRRHISYFNGAGSDLRYATCSSGCAQAANWEKVTVDEGSAQMGLNNSLAIGPDGLIHISYYDRANDDRRVVCCVSDCTKPWNWTKVRVATGPVGPYTSLALEASGRVHVSYFGDRTLSLGYRQERHPPSRPGAGPGPCWMAAPNTASGCLPRSPHGTTWCASATTMKTRPPAVPDQRTAGEPILSEPRD